MSDPVAAGHKIFVAAALFSVGAVILILEIVGARILSPVYGGSLLTWSAVISTTLAALALGAFAGGLLADRKAGLLIFCHILAVSAFFILLVSIGKGTILRLTTSLGLGRGVLAASLLLLAPPLAGLGFLTPLGLKLTTSSLDTLGLRAGSLYALSTFGSVLGALCAGYYLLPHHPIPTLLVGLAAFLFVLAAVGYGLGRSTIGAPAAGLAAFGAIGLAGISLDGNPGIVFDRESFYGRVQVLDRGHQRLLLIDGAAQTTIDQRTGEAVDPYLHNFELAALLSPHAKRALALGLGPGVLQRVLDQHYGISTDVVEINPVVVDAARAHFGLHDKSVVFIEDARTFLERSPRIYDLVFHDTFGGDHQPPHLFTDEFIARAHAVIKPDGVLAVNFLGMKRGVSAAAWKSVYRTLQGRFQQVRVFAAGEEGDLEDILFFASDAPVETKGIVSKARPAVKVHLERMLLSELTVEAKRNSSALVLKDDFCPLEFLNEPAVRAWRRDILMSAPGHAQLPAGYP